VSSSARRSTPPELSFEPLTPTAFLRRSASVFADRIAVLDGELRLTYRELANRSGRLAGLLVSVGVTPGDRVAVLAPNSHVLLESHFGVPMAGAVLVALNTRLAVPELGFVVEHSGSRVLIYDHELSATAQQVADSVPGHVELIAAGSEHDAYEVGIARAPFTDIPVADECDLISLNYTSGTTGRPKGVMYHHRGAYLQGLAQVIHAGLSPETVFLWTLPMFHCNGWTYPWAVTAAGGTHVCLRRVEPSAIWGHIREGGTTHFMAAPTVLVMLAADPGAEAGPAPRLVKAGTGGAPPSPALLENLADLNIEVTHFYGLTETFGPIVVCQWRHEWDGLDPAQRARLKARQGVANVIAERVRVVDENGCDVPSDGSSMGEIAVRGNDVMRGYFKTDESTASSAPDGWLRTGDIGVMHADGYVELRDRSKDLIISGGENVSSVEVEQVIAAHPSVLEVAVVAAPDVRWGEVPVAFVTLRDGEELSAAELTDFVRERLAGFKTPKRVVFGGLPKTSTGKILKYVLRGRARGGDGQNDGDGDFAPREGKEADA